MNPAKTMGYIRFVTVITAHRVSKCSVTGLPARVQNLHQVVALAHELAPGIGIKVLQ
jgi:hypothetical protein